MDSYPVPGPLRTLTWALSVPLTRIGVQVAVGDGNGVSVTVEVGEGMTAGEAAIGIAVGWSWVPHAAMVKVRRISMKMIFLIGWILPLLD